MSPRNTLFVVLLGVSSIAFSQTLEGTKPVDGTDSTYFRTFVKPNDIRVFYGMQGNEMVLGSVRDGSPDVPNNIYHNTNDFIGIGGTYKWLDGDLSFSLPGTTYLHEERSNLDQFRLSASYTRRKISYRGYLSDSKGVVVSGNQNEYESAPSIHEFRMGLQGTYIFNETKYSYRAALYQSEKQLTTAGSFLIRTEVFYRSLGGSGQPIIPEPYDVEERFGEQVGLAYLKAPGILMMPGYGINFVFHHSKLFVSPLLLAGAGAAFNRYEANKGTGTHTNVEYNAYFLLNAGYNGSLFYGRLQFTYSAGYAPIKPAYLSSSTLMASMLVGFRFVDLEHMKQK